MKMKKAVVITKNLFDKGEYNEYIEDSLKSLGFSEELDEMYYDMKLKLFNELYESTISSGAGFDPEIFFSGLVDDMNQTYNEVIPYLLQIKRNQDD
jgi:hypothetical protein